MVKDYFTFSKRERTGGLVLVILIGIIFLLPEFLPRTKNLAGVEVLDDFTKAADSIRRETTESTSTDRQEYRFKEHANDYRENVEREKSGRLFHFDPNTISQEDWLALGVSRRTAETIGKFLSKGGSFKQPEDIGKIYGLSRAQYDRLLPYVQIKVPSTIGTKRNNFQPRDPTTKPFGLDKMMIDINSADTSMLIALPGIGSKLANRIINFRDKLGGFYSIDQVKEVYGLPDSTYQLIRPFFTLHSAVKKIDINTATTEQLKAHPYLKWNLANAIVNYRTQHGLFEKLDDLLKIDIITPETLDRLRPYFAIPPQE